MAMLLCSVPLFIVLLAKRPQALFLSLYILRSSFYLITLPKLASVASRLLPIAHHSLLVSTPIAHIHLSSVATTLPRCIGMLHDYARARWYRWLILNSEMNPEVGVSVLRLAEGFWGIGSSKICERIAAGTSAHNIIWEDGINIFCIRDRMEGDPLSPNEALETGLVHRGGTSAAVWKIGENTFCKVKAWHEGMELESETIKFVRENAPDIPVPEVIHTWIDHKWNRTFLILKRVRGQTLDLKWPQLQEAQRTQIGIKVAEYCHKLSMISSSRFQSATGQGILEPFLNSKADLSHPSWMPRPIGPFSPEDLISHLSAVAPEHELDVENTFLYYHSDLGPTNIMIWDDPIDGITISGILDWESAGYYPSFWVATKPLVSAGFFLGKENPDRMAWKCILTESLKAKGFSPNIEGYNVWGLKRSLG